MLSSMIMRPVTSLHVYIHTVQNICCTTMSRSQILHQYNADMDACLSWSVPAVTKPLRSERTIAGAPLKHDSLYPDYRCVSFGVVDAHSRWPRSVPYASIRHSSTQVAVFRTIFCTVDMWSTVCASGLKAAYVQRSFGAQASAKKIDHVQLVHRISKWNA